MNFFLDMYNIGHICCIINYILFNISKGEMYMFIYIYVFPFHIYFFVSKEYLESHFIIKLHLHDNDNIDINANTFKIII